MREDALNQNLMTKRLTPLLITAFFAAAGCTPQADRQAGPDHTAAPGDEAAFATAQDVWWERIQDLCGNAYAGEMVRFDPEMDTGWLDREVIMHVRECSPDEIRIPLHVGENRSRTWVLTRTPDGIRLKHDHRYPDGSEEESSQYGGHTVDEGTASRQVFPAGDYSKALFERLDHPDGVHNVWAMEVHPGERFSYGLTRPNREFGADFDLSRPVDAPPPPWVIEPQQQ
jgi:hypothetical protein